MKKRGKKEKPFNHDFLKKNQKDFGKSTTSLMGSRKGLSTVVITLIIILISLVAVGIVWVVVRNVINTGTKEIALGQFTLDAKILNVNTNNVTNNVSLTLKRNAGQGEFSKMNFVFSDGRNSEVITVPISLNELEERNFMFHLSILNVNNLISISIVPYVKQDNKEVLGNVLDKYTVGGGTSTGIILPVCIPATCGSLGYSCGIWNNGTNCAGSLNCGNCTSGYSCNSGGICILGSCTPATCASQGYVCGNTWLNGTCSGNLNCGNCSSGFTCNMSGRCIASGTYVYPIKLGANPRILYDQNNKPFLMIGDSSQALIGRLTLSEASSYFANRKAKGFNTDWIHVLCGTTFGCSSSGAIVDGNIVPFTTTGDISTPNPVYFQRVDDILNLAAQNGIVVVLDPAETIDWIDELRSNGATKAYNYGVYLGNRYKNFPNIIWMSGNDFQTWNDPTDDALARAVANGIKSVDSNHIHTVELNYLVSNSLNDPTWLPIISLNAVYTYYATYAEVLNAYNSGTIPVFMVEANYEFESLRGYLTTANILRRQEYWTQLSGATGQLYGADTWRFPSGWQNHLNTTGVTQLGYMKNLFESISWYDLVPDQSHSVVTAGYGTFSSSGEVNTNDYLTAASFSNGSLAIAYMPTIRTINVNMSKFSSNVSVRWYDPSNGIYTIVAGSPFPNTGTKQFIPTGNNADGDGDWVLVMEAISGPATCTPTTCSALGYTCGTWSNGTCAGTLNCGSCGGGYNCVSGTCQAAASLCTGLKLLMHFDNRSSIGENNTYVSDISGNGNNGLWRGDAVSDADSGPKINGKYNGSFMFDGTGDYIRISTTPSLDITGTELTIAFWMNWTDLANDDGLIVKAWNIDSETNPYYQYGVERYGPSANYLNFIYATSASTFGECSSSTFTPTLNRWYHIVFTRTGSTGTWYINGTAYGATCTAGSPLISRGSTNLNIGADASGAQAVNGRVDDVAIWNRSLSSSEVSGIYSSGTAINC